MIDSEFIVIVNESLVTSAINELQQFIGYAGSQVSAGIRYYYQCTIVQYSSNLVSGGRVKAE